MHRLQVIVFIRCYKTSQLIDASLQLYGEIDRKHLNVCQIANFTIDLLSEH